MATTAHVFVEDLGSRRPVHQGLSSAEKAFRVIYEETETWYVLRFTANGDYHLAGCSTSSNMSNVRAFVQCGDALHTVY